MGVPGLCVCLIVGCAARAAPAESDLAGNPALDGAFQTLARLELGQDFGVFHPIRQAISQAHSDEPVRADLEARFVAVLQGEATDPAKQFACRQLAIVGSDAAIPVLAELLSNPRLSHMARYALEGIAGPVAIKSLRHALGTTQGRQRVGVVISLGRLADAGSVAAISDLLDQRDEELYQVGVVALGRIGTVPAADALRRIAGKEPDALRHVVVDAQLAAAEALCQQGKYRAAAQIYESLQSADTRRVQAAAFRGRIFAGPSESLTRIIAGLAAEEPWKRAVAEDCVRQLKQPEEIKTIAAAIPDLPIPGKIAALSSLKHRGDPAIRGAALKALDQANTDLCTVALEALIVSGKPADVPMLASLAATSGDSQVRDAARNTLRVMSADGTNQAMISLMNEDIHIHPVVVQCAAARRSPELVPAFLQAAQSANSATRLEAFKALEVMATQKDVESLVDLLCRASPGAEREAAGRAVWMSCQKISDPVQRSAPLLAAISKADAAGQCAILPSLARMGGKEPLAAVHRAMQSTDQSVRDAGYRALANWPNAVVAAQLLDIATTSEVESYRIWSLRAYARVVSLPSERPPQKTFEMLNSAMALATRTEDKELIVARLGSVRAPDALTLLLSFLDDPQLKQAAVPAIFMLAKGLSQSHPVQAEAAIKQIRSLTKDEAMLQQIPKVLRDMEIHKQGRKE